VYPDDALLTANYSVPILWLSLFDTDGLVTWAGFYSGPFTTVVQPRSACIECSRTRLEDWSRRWPDVFQEMSETWLGYISAVDCAYLAIWAEGICGMYMTRDEEWAPEFRAYLSGLDDPESAGFGKALRQS
jgi:hypothetical protein